MTYRTAVELFKTKYRIYALTKGIKEIRIGNTEIFILITEAYARYSNKHKLIQKVSVDNTTAQTNLVSGQRVYTSGTGADNIPNDIDDIYLITLNDSDKTPVDKVNISSLRGMVSGSGTPTKYAIDKTAKVLELNASPTASYADDNSNRLIIHYTARVEPFTGTAVGSYATLDFTATGYGGSFLTDDRWSYLFVMSALSQVSAVSINEVENLEQELIQSRPAFYNTELPTYLGVYEDSHDDSSQPGTDEDR